MDIRKYSTGAAHSPRLARFFFALAILLAAGCAHIGGKHFDQPDIELLALEPMPEQGMEARFLMRLRIVNPNSIPLDIEGMAYDVFIRDSKILFGVSNKALRVNAYS